MNFRHCTFRNQEYPITYELYGNVKNDHRESVFSRKTILEIGLAAILYMDDVGPREVSYIDEGIDTEYRVWLVEDRTELNEFTRFIVENGVQLQNRTIDQIKVIINSVDNLSIRVMLVDHESNDDIYDLVWVRHDPIHPGQLN